MPLAQNSQFAKSMYFGLTYSVTSMQNCGHRSHILLKSLVLIHFCQVHGYDNPGIPEPVLMTKYVRRHLYYLLVEGA